MFFILKYYYMIIIMIIKIFFKNRLIALFKSTKNNLSKVFVKIFLLKIKGIFGYFLVIFNRKIFRNKQEKLNFC